MMIPFRVPHYDLVEIEVELGMIRQYKDILEQHLRFAKDQNNVWFNEQLRMYNLSPDDSDWDAIAQEADYIVEILLPRIFRGPFIIALWGVYESSIIRLANLMTRRNGVDKSLSDCGRGFMRQTQVFFNDILQFGICDSSHWKRLEDLYLLRNALAHANGYLQMVKDPPSIEELARRRRGISVKWDYVLMTEHFLQEEYELVNTVVRDMLRRYSELYASDT